MVRTILADFQHFHGEYGKGYGVSFEVHPIEYLNVQLLDGIVSSQWTTDLRASQFAAMLPGILPEPCLVEIATRQEKKTSLVANVQETMRTMESAEVIRIAGLVNPEVPVAGGLLFVWNVRSRHAQPPYELGVRGHTTQMAHARTLIPETATRHVRSSRGLFDRLLGELSRAG